jgi:hypothetical protein
VEAELELALVLPGGLAVPLPTRFCYRADDPYAVHLYFFLEAREPVHWTFARALLTAGMSAPVGSADVRVWPGHDHTLVYLYLASPDGAAQVEIPAVPLADWLGRIHRLVPPGQEDRHLDLDALLSNLLHPETPR